MRIFLFLFFLTNLSLYSQHSNLLLGNNYSSNFNYLIYNQDVDCHTSFRPLIKSDLSFDVDSILEFRNRLDYSNWYLRKLFSEHLIILKGQDYKVIASPVINLSTGNEVNENKSTFTNTRGFLIEGNLGKKISFYSSFFENQSIFPNYVNNLINEIRVVPGQGYARKFKETGFDYAMSSGYFSYRPNTMFAIQFGHGKHFIGDGYRSLLLSDNTFNYPYLRIQTTFWKVQYTNLYTEFQDINYFLNNGLDNYDQMGYAKKYMSAHYLSVNINKKLNISLFESVVWRMNHAPGSNGFDINYLNPIAMLRPIEFSVNSPDNVLVGINGKYKMPFSSYLYGQLVLDEFSLNDLQERNEFWGNKFGFQFGVKAFNVLDVNNLTFQAEYNYVRPYTYAHHNPQQNYAHYNQPLAHPLGANFSELLLMGNYRWKKWELSGKMIFAKYGSSFENDSISYGNNLYESTGNFEEPNGTIHAGRPSDFGIEMYQGNLTNISLLNLNLGYVINPKMNLKINSGITLRDFKSEDTKMETQFINFGIQSDLFNHYYDF